MDAMMEPSLQYVHCPDAAEGHRMAWWQWGDVSASHLIVCVHGLSRQGRDFDVLAKSLLARAREQGLAVRIVCPDIVGRGESDWLKDPMGYQFPTYVADVVTMLGALHDQAVIRVMDWVGTSMGGVIGMYVAGAKALSLPAPVRRLVLNDVGPTIEWAALERIGLYLGKSGTYATPEIAAAHLRVLSPGFGPHTDAQWMALTLPMLRAVEGQGYRLHYDPAIAVPYASLTAELAQTSSEILWQLYDQIEADTLLLRGAQSDLLSEATASMMMERGPRPRLVSFEGVGHAPTLVASAQAEAVVDFLLSNQANGRGAT